MPRFIENRAPSLKGRGVNRAISAWAEEGFDEEKSPFASGFGKGVFHQRKIDSPISETEDFSKPYKTSFDFGSASKSKAIKDLNKRLKRYGVEASVGYPGDDSGNDYITIKSKK